MAWLVACGGAPRLPAGAEDGTSGPDVVDPSSEGTSTTATSSSSSGVAESSGTGDDSGEPACCGGLCSDPSWSCTDATCVDADGHALALVPEAGFFEIAGGTTVRGGWVGQVPTARVFYSFHPADDAPASRPLLVFFNGGPGNSTAVLLGLNTAPITLDPERGGPTENPASWTRFANLLHIDAPATGFSYSRPNPTGGRPALGIEVNNDAATFVRVVLRFLAHHPQLDASKIVLVGESYGGVRATAMLQQLVFHTEIAASTYPDVMLADEIAAYYDRVLGEGEHPPEQVASRFATALIQPLLACEAQREFPAVSPCGDAYQCDAPMQTVDALVGGLQADFVDPELLATVLGADPGSIAWLLPEARTDAYGRGELADEDEAEADMRAAFGALAEDDRYYLQRVEEMTLNVGFPDYCPRWDGRQFLRVAALVPSFITHAAHDGTVPSEGLIAALADLDTVLTSLTHETDVPADAARPGNLHLAYGDSTERDIRFPPYEAAGHMVSWRAGPELGEDVEQWLASLEP